MLYDSELAAGHRSTRVSGTYTPRDALRRLLSGTGLIVRYSRTDAAIITRPGAIEQPPLVPLGRVVVRERIAPPRFLSVERLTYYAQLESELHAHLVSSERTGRLAFSVLVHLQVSSDGRLSDVAIRRSSGNRKTDALVAEALLRATVSPPPDGLVQPLAVALRGARRADQR
ncbi:TonB family protein [Hephaestia caeni]|uniref:TonB family protein n=1 Tax=Hephaestia caeni TaxID=645617 RepID=UPI003CCC7DF4